MTSRKRLGVVMDPIGAISYAKDSTLAMLLAAQARGFKLAYLEQGDLKKAIESLARVRELAPDRKDLRLHYAMGLLRAGRTDEGKAELRQLSSAPEDFPGKASIPALLAKL